MSRHFGAELRVDAQARIVDQDVDLGAQLVDAGGQPIPVRGHREIGADRDGVLVAAELRAQALQPVFPSGGDDDAVAAGHQLTGELFADT